MQNKNFIFMSSKCVMNITWILLYKILTWKHKTTMLNITFIPGQLKTFNKYDLNKGLQKLLNL